MVSKNRLKFIKSLQLKKCRKKEQRFLVEGAKSVLELLSTGFQVEQLLTSETFYEAHRKQLQSYDDIIVPIDPRGFKGLGTFQSNHEVLAIAKCKPNQAIFPGPDEYALVLDRIRDPGNLGAILRIADWYGISKVICSPDCAEFYSPKVIQASMGSFTRVVCYYVELADYLVPEQRVFGAMLGGKDVHEVMFPQQGFILIGNESQGIDPKLKPVITESITIPGFGGAESLNAAAATAVICDVWRQHRR